MNYYQIIFSPTKGTQKVAEAITKNWENVETIDLSMPDVDYTNITLEDNALVLIAMPSFGGVAPQLALDRLALINGNNALCVLCAVYGNRAYENTLVQMEDTANMAHFKVIAAISGIAEHSIIHEYATNRPNSDDCEQLSSFGTKILNKFNANDLSKPNIPGKRPYKKSSTGMVPKANASCISCGLCAKNCPASAIALDNLKVADESLCISCMRCVSICPRQARQVDQTRVAMIAKAIKEACEIVKANELFI